MESKVQVLNCTVNWFPCFLRLSILSGAMDSTPSILTHCLKKKKKITFVVEVWGAEMNPAGGNVSSCGG